MNRETRRVIQREIDHDRRAEWRLIPLALIAFSAIALFVVLHFLFD